MEITKGNRSSLHGGGMGKRETQTHRGNFVEIRANLPCSLLSPSFLCVCLSIFFSCTSISKYLITFEIMFPVCLSHQTWTPYSLLNPQSQVNFWHKDRKKLATKLRSMELIDKWINEETISFEILFFNLGVRVTKHKWKWVYSFP